MSPVCAAPSERAKESIASAQGKRSSGNPIAGADREAAATALEKLSTEALPALRLAVNSRDQEVRSRAQALLEKIDSDLMTQRAGAATSRWPRLAL